MTAALVRKELQQHWLTIGLLVVLTVLGYAIVLVTATTHDEAGSLLDSLRAVVLTLVVLGSLLLGNCLVAGEYHAKTQLFLAALPLARSRMISVKYVLGLVSIVAIVGMALVIACGTSSSREFLTLWFVSIMATKALGFSWCVYTFFFMMGFMGRYRLPILLGTSVITIAVDRMTGLEIDRFGPFLLMNEQFAYEREAFPKSALAMTVALTLGCLFLIYLLGLVREGGVAELLAEKMSHREKVMIATLVTGFTFAIAVLDERQTKQPFDLVDAVTVARDGIVVKVASPDSGGDAPARQLAGQLAAELKALKTYLNVARLPPVFVTARSDLDPDQFERGTLTEAEGVLVSANYEGADWNVREFLPWLIREVLVAHTQGRAKLESKMWVLDGCGLFFLTRRKAASALRADPVLALRALYGTPHAITRGDLRQWLRFRERIGAPIAEAVAWSGLRSLAIHQGPEHCQSFLRSVLGQQVPKDLRALVHERRWPLDKLLARRVNLTMDEFLTLWNHELARARKPLRTRLSRIPRITGEVSLANLSSETRAVRYHAFISPPPSSGTQYAFLYHELPLFDREVAPQSIRRELHLWGTAPVNELPMSFPRGARLYSTIALRSDALGCEVISGWTRREIR